jgi:hypothetical protein
MVASDGATCASVATLESASLVLRETAPDAGVLAGLQSPSQAGLYDLAATADHLGFFDLQKGRAGVPDGEEQLRVFLETG